MPQGRVAEMEGERDVPLDMGPYWRHTLNVHFICFNVRLGKIHG
jgi:hypothetical protein